MALVKNESIKLSQINRKKAYFAMCRATLLLFVFVAFSRLLEYGITILFYENPVYAEGIAARCFSFFGLSRQNSIVAAKSFVNSISFVEFVNVIATMITMVFPAVIFAKVLRLSHDECFVVKGKTVSGIFSLFALCQIITITCSNFSVSIYGFILPDAPATNVVSSGVQYDIYSVVIKLLCVVVLVPVAEEYIFRGVILTYLRRFGLTFSVIASACLFGVAHSLPSQSVYAFAFGVIAAFLTVVTGNIKTAVIFHASNNLITVASQILPSVMGNKNFDIFYCVYIIFVSAFAFLGMYRLIVKDRLFDVFREKAFENDGVFELKPGIWQILTFPLVIYVLYYALTVVTEVFN